MSDTALNKFIQFGTTAQRGAFVPDPPAGSRISYFFFDTDLSSMYAWNGSAFVLVTAATGGITALTGNVTASGSGSVVATIANDAVTFAKIQNITTDRLLGRDTASSGDTEEIPVSSGLEFTGGPGLRVTVPVRTEVIGITVDGAGSVLTTGSKGFKSFPVAGTIVGWRLIADQSGDIEFDIQKGTYAAFPTNSTIVAAAPPILTAVQKNEDTTLTGWTTSVSAGDIFEFIIGGTPASITRVTLELTIVITG